MSDRVPSEDPVLRIVRAAKEYVVRSERDLQAIKAPHTIYEAAVTSVRNNINQAFLQLPSASTPSDICWLQDDIVRFGGQLKELEYQHKATLRDREVAYEDQRKSVLETLCVNLVTILGLPLVESTVQTLSNQTLSNGRGGTSPTRRGRTRAESSERAAPSAAEHEPTTDAAHPKNPSGTTSRKRTRDGHLPSSRHKRSRVGSVHFDQVFEDGQAQNKRIIVQHPKENGRWYILRCDEHNLDFRDKPVVSAGAHVRSVEHGKLSRDTAVVIEHFGTEVLGCDKVMAAKNNAVARDAFKMARFGGQAVLTGDDPLSTHPGRNRTQSCRDASSGGNRSNQRGREPVLDPTPGDVYLGFWGKAKKPWAVLLLPTKNISDVGVPDTIESLGLTETVPTCYDYDRRTKEFSWAKGYEDGGALVARREFPVLYFDGRRKSSVGWLGARDLVPFNTESAAASNVPHIESVRKYLQRQSRVVSADTTASSVIGDGGGQQESSPPPRADPHNPDSPPSYGEEAPTVPQIDPSDGQRHTGSNTDTSANDQFGQSDSPPEEPSEVRRHEDLPHGISQTPVPEPTAGKHAAMSGQRGPDNQQHGTDATVGKFVGGLDIITLTKIAQDAQRAVGPEKMLPPAAQDVRSSPAAHVFRNPMATPTRHTQPSSALCGGTKGVAPGGGQLLGAENSALPSHQHPWQSGAVAGSQDLNSAHHSANSVIHRAREAEEEGEPIRGPLQQLRPILPAPNLTTPLRLPPIRPPQGQADVPQLERLTSLLQTAPPAATHQSRPETPAQSDRSNVLLKSAAVPEVSPITERPTSCAPNDSDAPGNSSWFLTFSNRLLGLLAKYSKNSHPKPDDFKDAQNLYHCPLCRKEFARQRFFTRHLFENH